MVGPSTLSTAMSCPRKFKALVESSNLDLVTYREDKIDGNQYHKLHGMLLESILQFVAVGNNLPKERNMEFFEARYQIVRSILNELESKNPIFTQEQADMLLMKESNSRLIIGSSVSDLVSSIDESVKSFLDFVEDYELADFQWNSEVEVSGTIETPFGEVQSFGRIDLMCLRENRPLIIEIKKRDTLQESDKLQALFYAGMHDRTDCEICVINGNSFSEPAPAGPVNFGFTSEDGDKTEPNPRNCNSCFVLSCPEFVLGN